jgi:hypothetical protein
LRENERLFITLVMQCPHCLEHFHDKWTSKALVKDDVLLGVAFTTCAACKRPIIELGQMLQSVERSGTTEFVPNWVTFRCVYPKAISRSPIPKEVPKDFATDYTEACLVLPDSEKASAALSRRCLQHLLREEAGVKKDDLAKEIQQVRDAKQLPGHLAEDLDAVRIIGNFAAHPIKSTHTGEIVEVEPNEAEWSLNVLEGLFDFYFVQPARAKTRRDALNQKLQAAGKPPMKQP